MDNSYPFLADTFRGRCIKVVDGDTIDVELDVGFRARRTERLRLLGVDTPELHDRDQAMRQAALAAADYVTACLIRQTSGEWPLKVQTVKADAFGRYLARVWWRDRDGFESELNADLLKSGLAMPR